MLFEPILLCGQSLNTLRGVVRDSIGHPIPGANVWAYIGIDTLYSITNGNGEVKFDYNYSSNILIRVMSIGYEEGRVVIKPGKNNFEIVLKDKVNFLKEVIVRGKVDPITIKQDTVEYDVSHFIQSQDDLIQDLLAKLPGLQVNPDGTISIMGKKISKIKINGQEFLVNDITTLTSIIPADLINKIQLIDDYGEESNLTGRRTSESKKVINLTTSTEINSFFLERLIGAYGNQNLYTIQSNSFLYTSRQSFNMILSNNNIGINAGKIDNTDGEILFKRNINKRFVINTGLSYKNNSAEFESKINAQVITSEGALFNNMQSNGTNKIKSIFPKIELLYNPNDNNQLIFHFKDNLQKINTVDQSINKQSGFQKKEQFVDNSNYNNKTEYESDLLLSHRFKKNKRVLILQFNFKNSYENPISEMNNKLKFYSKDSSFYDSTLNQLIIKHSKKSEFKNRISYIEPLNNVISMGLNYEYQYSHTINNQNTSWMNEERKYVIIDTLRNDYKFTINQHKVEVNLQYKKGNFEYVVGANITPFSLKGNTDISGKSLFPIIHFSYNKMNSLSIKFNYNGESILPTFQQLANVPDYSDIQNPVYGNPNLKKIQKHSIVMDILKTDRLNIFMFRFSGIFLKNNIVSNSILVEDYLGTLKQETHFLNSNGNYLLENNNSWSRHFKNGKGEYSLEMGGNYTQNMLYYNFINNLVKSFTLISKAGINLKPSIFNLSLNTQYAFSRIRYTNDTSSIITQTINIFSYNEISFTKTFKCEVILSNQLNYGFTSSLNNNSMLLDLRLNKWWLNKKLITVLECNNLFNQGAKVTQSMTNNVITASTINYRGRYFLLKVTFDIKSINI